MQLVAVIYFRILSNIDYSGFSKLCYKPESNLLINGYEDLAGNILYCIKCNLLPHFNTCLLYNIR